MPRLIASPTAQMSKASGYERQRDADSYSYEGPDAEYQRWDDGT